MQLIKNNFLNLIVLILVVVILLQKCGNNAPSEKPAITRDTVWVHKDSVVYSKPQIIKTIPVNIYTDTTLIKYLPDSNYTDLLKQYQSVVYELLNKNVYLDSLKIDSLGYVKVLDTLSKNLIIGRSYKYDLKYPIVKETITLPAKKVNQVYVGGGLFGTRLTPIQTIHLGLLFKSKKDGVVIPSVGVDKNLEIQYGIQSYWKIKL